MHNNSMNVLHAELKNIRYDLVRAKAEQSEKNRKVMTLEARESDMTATLRVLEMYFDSEGKLCR